MPRLLQDQMCVTKIKGRGIVGVCGLCHVLQHKRADVHAVARQRAEPAGFLLCVT